MRVVGGGGVWVFGKLRAALCFGTSHFSPTAHTDQQKRPPFPSDSRAGHSHRIYPFAPRTARPAQPNLRALLSVVCANTSIFLPRYPLARQRHLAHDGFRRPGPRQVEGPQQEEPHASLPQARLEARIECCRCTSPWVSRFPQPQLPLCGRYHSSRSCGWRSERADGHARTWC